MSIRYEDEDWGSIKNRLGRSTDVKYTGSLQTSKQIELKRGADPFVCFVACQKEALTVEWALGQVRGELNGVGGEAAGARGRGCAGGQTLGADVTTVGGGGPRVGVVRGARQMVAAQMGSSCSKKIQLTNTLPVIWVVWPLSIEVRCAKSKRYMKYFLFWKPIIWDGKNLLWFLTKINSFSFYGPSKFFRFGDSEHFFQNFRIL